MNKNNKLAFAAVIAFLIPPHALADVATIDPNHFYAGQIITTADVRLSTETEVPAGTDEYGDPVYVAKRTGPVYAVDISGQCGADAVMCSPIGNKVFAPSPTGGLPNDANWGPGGWWGSLLGDPDQLCAKNCVPSIYNTGVFLRMDFLHPTNYVDALGFFNGGDPTLLEAFDSSGMLLGACITDPFGGDPCFKLIGPDPNHGFGWGFASVSSESFDISTVIVAGENSFRAIGEIDYDDTRSSVPLPEEIWLLLTGIALVTIFRLRACAGSDLRRVLLRR